MSEKKAFVYAYTEEARDMFLGMGYNLIKVDTRSETPLFIFENKGEGQHNFSMMCDDYCFSNTIWF